MTYDYDNKKIAAYVREKKMSARKAQMALNMSNVKALNGWMNGGDLRVSNLLHFVNTFRLNLLDFFTADGVPLSECTHEMTEDPCSEASEAISTIQDNAQGENIDVQKSANLTQLVIQHLKEMTDLREAHARELFSKEKELLLREMHNDKVMRQEYDTKLEAAVTRVEERCEQRYQERYAKQEKRYEQKLNEKDAVIEQLRQQLTELTVQYRELESSSKGVIPYQNSTMASDNLPQPFQKR